MQHEDAVQMLAPAAITGREAQQWADLGCGSGTFTRALASLLPAGSTLHAVDINDAALREIPDTFNNVNILKTHGDFITGKLPDASFNGILLANALHYVKDQPAFIKKTVECLLPSGVFILVEYNTTASNPWVPYPLDKAKLKTLFTAAGFSKVTELAERPSLYGRAKIYAVLVSR